MEYWSTGVLSEEDPSSLPSAPILHHSSTPFFFLGRLLLVLAATSSSSADAGALDSILGSLPPPYRAVVADPDRFGLQILYTQVDRDGRNRPEFTHYSFHVDKNRYFYPASLVKLPVAALALEKIRKLDLPHLTRRTRMHVDRIPGCAEFNDLDSAGHNGFATVESCIQRMLLVSDNDGYNRLWEFLTRDYASTRLSQVGFDRARLLHVLAPCGVETNRVSSPVRFLASGNRIVYEQPRAVSTIAATNPLAPVTIGERRMENGIIVPFPFVADNLNYLPLEEIHRFLIGIMFPWSVDKKKSLRLAVDEYRFLRDWMCMLPRESGIADYASSTDYPDNYKKYLVFGDGRTPCRPELREFNVVGRAYGFMSDVAYFADFTNHVEFFLSAAIFVNDDGVINNDEYEYATVGLPFLAALGAAVYEYEKSRPRRHRPDLRAFAPRIRAESPTR